MTPAIIVAHGQPSAPEAPDAAIAALARAVEREAGGRRVAGATLAMPGALGRAADAVGATHVLVYPFFMSDGWFVSTNLPRRLERDLTCAFTVLPPFGLDPALKDLAARAARTGAERAGLSPADTRLVLTAHGSPSDPRPAVAATALGEAAGRHFASWRVGFVDEEPSIEAVARGSGPAICLPLFAAENGHVRVDMRRALDEAEFTGPILPAIGTDAEVPFLIASALHGYDPGAVR